MFVDLTPKRHYRRSERNEAGQISVKLSSAPNGGGVVVGLRRL